MIIRELIVCISLMTRVYLTCGPMGSGKTTSLISQAKCLPADERLVINHSLDNRYANSVAFVTSHNSETLQSISSNSLMKISDTGGGLQKRIFVDEVQFFTVEDIKSFIARAKNAGVLEINFFGLDYAFDRSPFDSTMYIQKIADHVTTLNGECGNCSKYRSKWTYRRGKSPEGGPVVVIGGFDSYVPVCDECYDSLLVGQ